MTKPIQIAMWCLAMLYHPFLTTAQECSTEPTAAQIEHLSRNVEARMHFSGVQDRSGGIHWVPIQFHECVPTPGSLPQVYPLGHIDVMMNQLNTLFLPYNIQFFECSPIHVFASGTLHSFDSSEEPQLAQYETTNVLNVYFFEAVSSGGTPVCGYSYLPPSADRVIIRKSCMYEEVFLHEMGHYFSLYHTHGKSNSVRTDELVNGSNCQHAGDDVCDTPADPNVFRSYGYMNGCTYIGQINDANGQPYAPDPTNYMCYANIGCKTHFSTQQLNRMAYSALNDRAYLTGCQHPNACSNPITTLPYHADFEAGMENWSNVFLDPSTQVNFQVGSGATPTPGTGPDAAFSGSNYLFIESNTLHETNRAALVRSPCFDLRGYNNPKMSFRYHSFGTSFDAYGVAVSMDGGYDWYGATGAQLLQYGAVNNSNQWNQVVCDLSAFKTARYFQVGIFCGLLVDSLGDFAIDSIRIYEDTPVACNLSVFGFVNNVTCDGLNNGFIALSVSGNNLQNATYTWSNGHTTGGPSGLSPGSYTVTVSTSPECSNIQTFNVLSPQLLVVNGTPAHSGAANGGSIVTNVSGGTGPYYYAWSNNSTTADLSGVLAGTYNVTVTDSKDCSVVRTYVIIQPVVCSTYYNTFPWTGSMESNFGIFERVNGYQTNWVRRSSPTANPNTGPDQAYHGSQYAFINSGNGQRTAVLRTKDCLNLLAVNNPVFEFYYHMFGAQMGVLYVEISIDNGTTWTTVWTMSGNQGNQWQKASISLQPYNTGATRIRLRGVANAQTSDMAIDALYIGPAGSNQFYPYTSSSPAPAITVSPNPSNGFCFVDMAEEAGFQSLEVTNSSGQIIISQSIISLNTMLDLTAQPSGIYYLRVFNEETATIKKIVLTR
jgi:MAM domain, meprin/A5/mu/Secretion system C-terminal sorting domain/Pregnancy-associated plasma protein-A